MVDKKHEVISELKRVRNELGYTPTRNEFVALSYTGYNYQTVFGTFPVALNAAGLNKEDTQKKSKQSAKLRVNEFFKADIEQMLAIPQSEVKFPLIGPFPKILCVGDLHCPFWHEPSIKLVYQVIEHFKPDYIIQMGDSYDFFSFSKFPRSPYVIDPGEEIRLARQQLETFWKTIHEIAPKAVKHQILGNHDVRPQKRIIETNCPELEYFFDFKRFFEYPNVITNHDVRTPVMISDIAFIHGHLSGQGRHRTKTKTHTVHGHTHSGGCIESKVDGRILFELDCGYLGDPERKVFNYTAVKETKWTRGVGIIDTFGANFVPFE